MDDISKEEDTVFEGDKGAKVVMDEPSLELLQGSRVVVVVARWGVLEMEARNKCHEELRTQSC